MKVQYKGLNDWKVARENLKAQVEHLNKVNEEKVKEIENLKRED